MGAGAIEMKESNLPWCSQVADVDHVNIAAGRRSDTARSFLADKDVTLLRGHCVVKPPHVVRLPADGEQPAELHWIRNGADSRSADVPDRYALVPKGGNHDAIANENVVHERTSHCGSEDLRRRGGISYVDNHQARW